MKRCKKMPKLLAFLLYAYNCDKFTTICKNIDITTLFKFF